MKKAFAKLSTLAVLGATAATRVLAANGNPQVISVQQLDSSVGVSSIGRLISAVFTAAVVLAVVFVFMQLIQGGYAWISAGGDKSKVEEARTRITNALIGLAIVASAWALIVVIGKFFGVSIQTLNLPSATGDFQSC